MNYILLGGSTTCRRESLEPVLSVMHVVGGVPLWVDCVFRRVDVVCLCLLYTPVAILGAVFCVICSLLMFVSDASGDHMVETYSSMGLVMALYVAMIVSFCFPHVVDVCALSICIVLRALVIVISMCLLYVSLGSIVSPSIFGLMFMGSVMLSICLFQVVCCILLGLV